MSTTGFVTVSALASASVNPPTLVKPSRVPTLIAGLANAAVPVAVPASVPTVSVPVVVTLVPLSVRLVAVTGPAIVRAEVSVSATAPVAVKLPSVAIVLDPVSAALVALPASVPC